MVFDIMGSGAKKSPATKAPRQQAAGRKLTSKRVRTYETGGDYTTPEGIEAWLANNRHVFTFPESTLGDEPNSIHKDWAEHDFKVCLTAWNGYNSLAGSLTMTMLYTMLHEEAPELLCERAYFPDDMKCMKIHEKAGIPIFSLESKHPLKDFDVVAFSVAVTGADVNSVKMMDMCGIPVRSKDRTEKDPLIIRGGIGGSNPRPYAPFYDLVFVGEAEQGLTKLLQFVREQRNAGVPREEILKQAANKFEGIYIPSAYEETYKENGWFDKIKVKEGYPEVINRAYIADPGKDSFMLTKPLLHYAGNMGLGECLVGMGCDNTCSFCSESNMTRPFREYTEDDTIANLKSCMDETGSVSVLPASFCLAGFTHRTSLIKRLYEEVSNDVKLISQRTDDFAENPGFVTLSRKAGNKNVSLGVEGLSQRLRNLVNKNVSTEQIIEATRNAFSAGYGKVKYFMIANLPGEEECDRQEFMEMVTKLADMKKEMGATTRLHFSWTNLNVVDHSPFQWYKPLLEARNLHQVLKHCKELDIMATFGASKSLDSDWWMQANFIGDSRLADAIEGLALDFGTLYFRGIKKGTMDYAIQKLSQKGVDPEVWFRVKDFSEEFAWDHISFGIDKEFLKQRFLEGQKFMTEASDGKPWLRCSQACASCGACTPEDHKIRRRNHANKDEDIASTEVSTVKPIRQKGTVQTYMFRLVTDKKHRFLPKAVKKHIFRRALYKAGVPTTKLVSFSADSKALDVWIYGVDYVQAPVHTHIFDFEKFVPEIQKHLVGMKIEGFKRFKPEQGSVKANFDYTLYEMVCGYSKEEMEGLIKDFMAAEPISQETLDEVEGKKRNHFIKENINVTRIKLPGLRGDIEQVMVDLRPYVARIGVVQKGEKVIMRAFIKEHINIYHLYRALTNRPLAEIHSFMARRVEFFRESVADMFAKKCSKCKSYLLKNVFDEYTIEKDVCTNCSEMDY